MPEISVVISTYNKPDYLEKVLWSYSVQSISDFEIVIADDGSDQETREMIDRFRKETGLAIKHVWQEDDGFRKTIILNKAILACDSDYVLMTDGDCVARADVLAIHLASRRIGHFISGGYFKLPADTSEAIQIDDIVSQRCFSGKWLVDNGLGRFKKLYKIKAEGSFAGFLNRFTTTKATWNGNDSSGWKQDMLAINGFDHRMQYGGEDREFGERLMNMGIKGIQLRYSLKVLHLYHDRPYVKPEMIQKNNAIRRHTKANWVVRTPHGIDQLQE